MPLRTYQFQVQALVTASSLLYTVSHSLALVSEATDGVRRDIEQDLSLTSAATWTVQPYNGDSVESELVLTQEAKAFGFETVSNTLTLSGVATREIFGVKPANSYLNFVSTAEYGYAIRNLSVEDILVLESVAGKAFTGNITSNLNLSSIAFRSFPVVHPLGLTSEADWGYGYDAWSILDLTSTVEVNKILNQVLSHTNIVSQASTYFIESPCNRHTFTSFHGTGGVAPASKKLNYANSFYLESIDDGTVVILRNPEVDDRKRYAFNRVNRNFFDGTPDIYVDEDWATEQSQAYTIVATKRADLESVFTFLQDNLGREVILKDWKGVTWVVVITNPGDLYSEDGEGYWTLNFETEGSAFDGEWFITHMTLSEDLSRAGSIYNRSATHSGVVSDLVGRNYDLAPSSGSAVSQDVSYVIE